MGRTALSGPGKSRSASGETGKWRARPAAPGRRCFAAARAAGLAVALAAACGCDGMHELMTLRDQLAAEFETPDVSIDLSNGTNLVVVFRNSPLSALPDDQREDAARRVAEFVRDRYPRYPGLRLIVVGFGRRMDMGPIQLSSQRLEYTFRTESLGPAPAAAAAASRSPGPP